MTVFEEIRLSDLEGAISIRRGFPTQRASSKGPVPVLSLAAVRNDAPPRHFADWADIYDLGLELAQAEDVLIAIEGGTVGEAIVVPPATHKFVASQQVATLRVVDRTAIDPWYLGAWLSTTVGREQMQRLARGSGIQRVPIGELSSLVIRIAPIEDQMEIGERYFAFEDSIRSHRAVTACLQKVRDLDLVVAFADGRR
jgi:restriction endonuclease S subunit